MLADGDGIDRVVDGRRKGRNTSTPTMGEIVAGQFPRCQLFQQHSSALVAPVQWPFAPLRRKFRPFSPSRLAALGSGHYLSKCREVCAFRPPLPARGTSDQVKQAQFELPERRKCISPLSMSRRPSPLPRAARGLSLTKSTAFIRTLPLRPGGRTSR